MQITVELPDDLLSHPDPAREALEAFALAGYRSGAFSNRLTRALLGLQNDYELDGFLKEKDIWERSYTAEDHKLDLATIERLSLAKTA